MNSYCERGLLCAIQTIRQINAQKTSEFEHFLHRKKNVMIVLFIFLNESFTSHSHHYGTQWKWQEKRLQTIT